MNFQIIKLLSILLDFDLSISNLMVYVKNVIVFIKSYHVGNCTVSGINWLWQGLHRLSWTLILITMLSIRGFSSRHFQL